MTMNSENFLDLDMRVRRDLNDLFGDAPSVSILSTCDAVESRLLSLTELSVVGEIQLLAQERNISFTSGPSGNFVYDGKLYRVRLTEPPTQTSIIQVTLKSVNPEQSSMVRGYTKISINSVGRFIEAQLRIEKIFSEQHDAIARTIETVFKTGYRWFAEYVRVQLDSMHGETAEELYSFLRQILPETIVGNIWLYAIINNHGLYIPSAINRTSALKLASKRVFDVNDSPLKLMVDFSTRLLDYDQLFAKLSIEQDLTFEASLHKAGYIYSGFQLAEQAIFQSDKLVSQALVREGKTLLAVGYPVELRSQVEHVLRHEQSRFKDILEKKASALKQVVNAIRGNRILSEIKTKYFEYAGAFIRGLSGLDGSS